MGLLILFLILPVIISAVAAYFVSTAVRNRMIKAGKLDAKISVIGFIASFVVILAVICLILVYNIRITR